MIDVRAGIGGGVAVALADGSGGRVFGWQCQGVIVCGERWNSARQAEEYGDNVSMQK
ncbi:MAG: hypothetical protein GY801_07375 [bacterium]|nr:hypothetical protein [bacterium]